MIPRDKCQAPQRDLLETYLEDILNPRHELVQIGKRIDWTACEQHFGQLYTVEAGRPGLPIRLHMGLQLLKHMYSQSDRDVLDRWVENPYWQHFCDEVIFQHRLPMDETTIMRFRHRIGEDGVCGWACPKIWAPQNLNLLILFNMTRNFWTTGKLFFQAVSDRVLHDDIRNKLLNIYGISGV
ncbi:transposase, partial [Halopseudomonas sp.]|uniref:transposase n=1 Tax=Halopseudomonas sp. TaxID=2901191 RepID=UPI0039E34C52